MTACHVVLVGLPGSGKTTVARAVGERTGYDVVELDSEIELLASASIPEIFASVGEAGFRRFEVEATKALLARCAPALVSPGAGWTANVRARKLVPPDWRLIYLRTSPGAAAARVAHDPAPRPLLAGAASTEDLTRLVEQMARDRVPLYERATATIDTEGASLDQVVERVAGLVTAWLGGEGGAGDPGIPR